MGDERAPDARDHLVDPDALARKFTSEHIRDIGQAIREFVRNYQDPRKPWYEACVLSAGNGTAMRTTPVGLVHLGDPFRICRCFLASPEDFEGNH